MKKLKNISKGLLSALVLVSVLGGFIIPSENAEAANYPITGQNYYLAGAGVTSSQTTVPLTSLKTPDGRTITMTMIGDAGYGTLEPQSPAKTELIKFTGIVQNGNGTASLTGVTRGIDFAYPYAASTTLRQAHSGGATFIISNTPNWYFDNFPIQGDDNVTIWPMASTSVPSRGYVDYVAFNGAGVINATTIAKGVVQIGTGAQAAASTALGSTGASLAIPTSAATSTYNSSTAANKVVVTGLAGKIDDNFIATSTLFATAITPVVRTYTASTTWSKSANLKYIIVEIQAGGGGGGYGIQNSSDTGAGGGGGGGYARKLIPASLLNASENVIVGEGGTGGNTTGPVAATDGAMSAFGSFASSTGGVAGGSVTNAAGVGGTGGVGNNGDLNLPGQSGGDGFLFTNTESTATSGTGGDSFFGKGATNGIANAVGKNGVSYGGGGSGGSRTSSGNSNGGNGARGVVTLTEYYI